MKKLAILFAGCLALAACSKDLPSGHGGGGGGGGRPPLSPAYRPSGHMAAGDVFVHLFDWRWDDIASECENVLGPAGYKAVQVSPPNEHSITPSHDWSERYQPVSYSIAKSRSGDSTAFVDMVTRCHNVGVGIYVDAVINHMTNSPSPGVGSNGTAYTKYDYPGPPALYTPDDFHTPCGMDFSVVSSVQDCELLGLPDLNTGLESVRRKIAGYLIELADLGVAGFRIDAAKHIQQVQLDSIFYLVDSAEVAHGHPVPYYFLEIVHGTPGAEPPDFYGEAYASGGAADITEFTTIGVGDKFQNQPGQDIHDLNPNGPTGHQFSPGAWGLMPSDKAIVFLQNHDTQHQTGSGSLSYRDGQVFRLANVWLLAQPYGYPSVLSSFAFQRPAENSMGPPSDANGWTVHVSCATSLETAADDQFVCEHRDPYILTMVAFRHYVAGMDQNHWWDDGRNAIAFSRGSKGFVAINREDTTVTVVIPTGIAPGNYCDIITGGVAGGGASCAGTAVTVDSTGAAHLSLPHLTAIAIHTGAHL